MRTADPSELTTPAIPVLAARLSETELSRLVPVQFKDMQFKDITDPEQTREPAKAALIRLDSGAYVVLFYGRESKELTVEFPSNADLERSVLAFLQEVRLPLSRVFWHRPEVSVAPLPERSPATAKSSPPHSPAGRKTAKVGSSVPPRPRRGHARAASKSSKKR
jgi:hypothetical protein